MKIGLFQYSPAWEDKNSNITKINDLISNFDKNTDLLIFPEMTLTGFTMDAEKYSEEIDGPSFRYFMDLSSKLQTDLISGIIEKDGKNIFNSLIHFNKDGLIKARYRKIHPFSFAGEDKSYSSGKETVITKINNHKIGLTICYDLRFPELYRLYGKDKVDLLINIANWPVKRIEHWKSLLKARAIENQCFVIGVNRVGVDANSHEYNGCSGVFDPMGKEIVLVENEEKIIYAEIDLDDVKVTRDKFHFLDDMKLV